ncbi:MAG: bifunctional glutamate N-acetyltransferase/amino-acid acetyltransferase ArgJ [Dehalococcoidia bacterium]|nr:bifunctional glutamate N-acetyltransferase/amino-acid acetyltransferase ArgJ [Dehalococcoidia bacterium]
MTIEFVSGGHVTTPLGFLAGATSAGIKTKAGALDLALLYSERDCDVAAVFTQNLVKGAPVLVSRKRVAAGRLRGVVVNSGCANALNGAGGVEDAIEMTRLAAAQLGLTAEGLSVSSTGVTGVRLPMDKVRAGLPQIQLGTEGGPAFARAIMTTDTRPKETAVSVTTSAGSYAIGGCCKGSGMIHPDMATMLCYVTTDAAVERGFLRDVQRDVADRTLNMVSIDGDTSCSDTFLLLANGAAGLPRIQAGTPEANSFREALLAVGTHLARELARDGEGAQRLIEVAVTGAASREDARRIARTISNSPLVKTAITGCDPNWGRILVAAGRAGANSLDETRASLRLQGESLYERGSILAFDEAAVSKTMDAPEVRIELDLGLGDGAATAWGCDLTVDYVHINADYRT